MDTSGSNLLLHHRIPGCHNFGVQFSPFFSSRIAVVSGANYGLAGNGRLNVFEFSAGSIDRAINTFLTQAGLFDLSWSEAHENFIFTASGDGSIQLFDVTLPEFPVRKWREHTRECFSINSNMQIHPLVVSSSWDGTIKVWSPDQQASIETFSVGSDICVYKADFSPHSGFVISSVSSDGALRIYDTRNPNPDGAKSKVSATMKPENNLRATSKSYPALSLSNAHSGREVLSSDWSKYSDTTIYTSGVDCLIKQWDLRQITKPVAEMIGHRYPARTVKASNHHANVLASCGYDMTTRSWQVQSDGQLAHLRPTKHVKPYYTWENHSEFVFGIDWSLVGDGSIIATASWDETVQIWRVPSNQGIR